MAAWWCYDTVYYKCLANSSATVCNRINFCLFMTPASTPSIFIVIYKLYMPF